MRIVLSNLQGIFCTNKYGNRKKAKVWVYIRELYDIKSFNTTVLSRRRLTWLNYTIYLVKFFCTFPVYIEITIYRFGNVQCYEKIDTSVHHMPPRAQSFYCMSRLRPLVCSVLAFIVPVSYCADGGLSVRVTVLVVMLQALYVERCFNS